jgi:hypothetical protein
VRVAPALLAAGALALAGCSGDGADEASADKPPPPKRQSAIGKQQPTQQKSAARKHDVAWLARLHKWELKLDRASRNVAPTAQAVSRGRRPAAALRRALRPLANCNRSLRTQVREPLVTRYESSYALFERACEVMRRLARDALADKSSLSAAKVRREGQRARDLFGFAHGDLETKLVTLAPLPTAGGQVARSRVEPRLTRVVHRLVYRDPSGSGLQIRCWSPRLWRVVLREWGAYAGVHNFEGFASGATQINISPRVCSTLAAFVYGDARPTSGRAAWMTAASVGVLSHEAQHLIDPAGSEQETECRGMQNVRVVARLLGASSAYSGYLAEGYWKYVYPHMSAGYRTRACHNGGPLDSRRGTDVWP